MSQKLDDTKTYEPQAIKNAYTVKMRTVNLGDKSTKKIARVFRSSNIVDEPKVILNHVPLNMVVQFYISKKKIKECCH